MKTVLPQRSRCAQSRATGSNPIVPSLCQLDKFVQFTSSVPHSQCGCRSGVRARLLRNPYGLTLAEVRAEIRRLSASGWQLWEVRRRFMRGTR